MGKVKNRKAEIVAKDKAYILRGAKTGSLYLAVQAGADTFYYRIEGDHIDIEKVGKTFAATDVFELRGRTTPADRINASDKYDKTYCNDERNFGDPKCRHERDDVVPYDMEFGNNENHPDKVQEVCTRCGRISKWCKVGKDNSWTRRF